MLKQVFTTMALCVPLLCTAQQENGVMTVSSASTGGYDHGVALQSYYEPVGVDVRPAPADSVGLPLPAGYGYTGTMWHYPLSWNEWCGWGLHKGLNVSLDASVFAEIGKHAHHGAGFAQSISAMYATPLTDRLSLAVGGYMSNVYWAHSNYREAGLTAMLNYRFDEHWEAFLYGKKSLVDDRHVPRPLYDMHALGDVVGGGVRYNFSPSFSMEVSVNYGTMPDRHEHAHDIYQRWR